MRSSLQGKRGQALLIELADALDAMPDKRLYPGSFATAEGEFCTLGVLGATLLFGFLQALAITLGGTDLLPPTLVTALPYLITIIALIFTGRSAAPKALGKPFEG